jgi:hypothetical protein
MAGHLSDDNENAFPIVPAPINIQHCVPESGTASTVSSQKIKKVGPFTLPAITPEFALFSHLLAHAVSQLKELPDFSDDTKIGGMSDFSGEHKGARFNTYSFLLMATTRLVLSKRRFVSCERNTASSNPIASSNSKISLTCRQSDSQRDADFPRQTCLHKDVDIRNSRSTLYRRCLMQQPFDASQIF